MVSFPLEQGGRRVRGGPLASVQLGHDLGTNRSALSKPRHYEANKDAGKFWKSLLSMCIWTGWSHAQQPEMVVGPLRDNCFSNSGAFKLCTVDFVIWCASPKGHSRFHCWM